MQTMQHPSPFPPTSVIAAHGAGSTPAVFRGWHRAFAVPIIAVDLQRGLDARRARMEDYADRLVRAAIECGGRVGVVGWSMGGLVAMMAVERLGRECTAASGLVVIEPSPPAQVVGYTTAAAPSEALFDPEKVYGPFPQGEIARPESSLARGQRQAGIAVAPPGCPMLVISGEEFPDFRGHAPATAYGGGHRAMPGRNHWQLVRDPQTAVVAAAFLNASIAPSVTR